MGTADGGVAVTALFGVQVVLDLVVHFLPELGVKIAAFVLLLELLLLPGELFMVIICLKTEIYAGICCEEQVDFLDVPLVLLGEFGWGLILWHEVSRMECGFKAVVTAVALIVIVA